MILHVACLPFPSHQGTQAAIDAMLRAWSASGQPAHLLTYAYGAHPLDAPYVVHRVPDFPKVRSLRSGPSLGKLALDTRCITTIRRLAARLRPEAIVAHHVEAAFASIAASAAPIYYFAHTSLSDELPVYFPRLPARPVGAIGGAVERGICARAAGVAAVAPALADMLSRARYVPIPWPCEAERMGTREARAALGLPADARVCLYAGNLDRYQGWERLLDALILLRRAHPSARLLIATVSNTGPARRAAQLRGVAEAVDFRALSSEEARRQVHGAADLAWVPRRTRGGLPIKMLEAFSRRVPVVAMERATAGLPVGGACTVVPNDDAGALAAAASRVLGDPGYANMLTKRASTHLASHHGAAAYIETMRHWLGNATTTPAKARQHARRPPTGRGLRAR